MYRIENFRRQHEALLEICEQLSQTSRVVDTREHASQCARLLARLTGILTQHLAAEDRALYPRLIASGNPHISDTARSFSVQMGGLAQRYLSFEDEWRSGQAILAEPGRFRAELLRLLAMLHTRIQREDQILYPMLENIEKPQHSDAA